MNSQEASSETDHLTAWETENPSQTTKHLKLDCSVHNNQLRMSIFNHNYRKMLGTVNVTLTRDNGSQILESALLKIGEILNKYGRNMIALSTEDPFLKHFSLQTLKEIANTAISTYQIIIFTPPKILTKQEEIRNTLNQFHSTPVGGHIGQHRMYLKIKEYYKWKNMKTDITNYVRNCEQCKINKVVRHTKEAEVVTTTPSKSFEVISADTVGPFTRTNNGNRYILSLQCNLSKYVVLVPIPSKEAGIIAKALVENFILKYGKFWELRTDQGTEYNNQVLEQVCKILEIKQTFSTAYHPQTIGALERNHRCLNEYLRCFVNAHQSDWDEWTKYYEFCFNTTPHTEHGFTPFELVFGHKANLPQNLIGTQTIAPVYDINQYYNELRFKIQNSNNIANHNLIEHKEKRQIVANNSLNPINLEVGDKVYLKNENRKKLDPFYTGPYIVSEMKIPNSTIVHPITNKPLIVHKNRLIKA